MCSMIESWSIYEKLRDLKIYKDDLKQQREEWLKENKILCKVAQ